MKKIIILSILMLVYLFVGCSEDREYEYYPSIENHSFETGSLEGWSGDLDSYSVFEDSTKKIGNDGRYYLRSNDEMTGTITSTKFKLNKNGCISLLIGAGNGECYIEIYNNVGLVKQIKNPYYNNFKDEKLRRVIIKLDEYVNEELYIKIVDNSQNLEYSYICIDSIDVNVTDTDYAIYKNISMEV